MRLTISLFLLAITASGSYGQLYIKAGGGYSFAVPSVQLGQNSADNDIVTTDPETGYYVPTSFISKTESVNGTYNTGAMPVVAVGYTFASNIGIELSAGYVFGKNYSFTDEYADFLDGEPLHRRVSTLTTDARNLYIAPSLLMTTDEKKLRPYMSLGFVLGLPVVSETHARESDFEFDFGTSLMEYEYSRGLAIGLRGGVGVDLKVGERLKIFLDVAFSSMTFRPRQREMLRYEVNGEDFMPTLSRRATLTHFVKDIEVDYRVPPNSPEVAAEEIGPSFIFGGLATTAGLKFPL